MLAYFQMFLNKHINTIDMLWLENVYSSRLAGLSWAVVQSEGVVQVL